MALLIFLINLLMSMPVEARVAQCRDPGDWFTSTVEIPSVPKILRDKIRKEDGQFVVSNTDEPALYLLALVPSTKDLSVYAKYKVPATNYYRAIIFEYLSRSVAKPLSRHPTSPSKLLWYREKTDISGDGSGYAYTDDAPMTINYNFVRTFNVALRSAPFPELRDDSSARSADAKPPTPIGFTIAFEYLGKVYPIDGRLIFSLNKKYDVKKFPLNCNGN